jgi:hypothetical protein
MSNDKDEVYAPKWTVDNAHDWRHNPLLLSLAILIQSLRKPNFEQARQETQTINRLLATGVIAQAHLVDDMLRSITNE